MYICMYKWLEVQRVFKHFVEIESQLRTIACKNASRFWKSPKASLDYEY